MHDITDCPEHGFGVFVLKDIPSRGDASCPCRHAFFDSLQYVPDVSGHASCDYDRDGKA